MTKNIAEKWSHSHNFYVDSSESERKVNLVFLLTTVTMVVEIVAGSWFGSMALLADGWHMFTHSAAFAVSMFVYWYSRKHRHSSDYSFGTGKVNSLGGFASAVALATVSLFMLIESTERLFLPQAISFNEAIVVAIVGFVVNVASVFLLHDDHHHHHHGHDHSHDHHAHHDHNLKAAYFHVLADTLTSLLAIVALILGKFYGWLWADAVMGIVGAAVIGKWAWGLMTHSSGMLLDKAAKPQHTAKVTRLIEEDGVSVVTDFHYWQLSGKHHAAIVSVATSAPLTPDDVKQQVRHQLPCDHITVEINPLPQT